MGTTNFGKGWRDGRSVMTDRVLGFYSHSAKAGLGHTGTCLASKKGQRAVHGGANCWGARHVAAAKHGMAARGGDVGAGVGVARS